MDKELLIEAINSELNITEIAKKFDCSRKTIYRYVKKYEIDISHKKGTISKEYVKPCGLCGKNTSSRRNLCGTCSTNIRRYRAKKAGVEYLGGKCNRCDWSGDISGFDFHHLRDKVFTLHGRNMANRKWEIVKEELDKCELLCALCHRLEHSNYRNTNFLDMVNNDNDDLIFKDK